MLGPGLTCDGSVLIDTPLPGAGSVVTTHTIKAIAVGDTLRVGYVVERRSGIGRAPPTVSAGRPLSLMAAPARWWSATSRKVELAARLCGGLAVAGMAITKSVWGRVIKDYSCRQRRV